jgi:uncharacterized membrane protein
MKRFTAIFLQGLVAILPLAVTILVLSWLGSAAERTLGTGIKSVLPDAWYIPGMGMLAGAVFTFTLGLLVNTWGVPQLIRFGEGLIGRIPLVKTIYGGVRDLLGFFSSSGELNTGNRAVIVSLGDGGIRVVGLLTRERFDDLPPGFGSAEDVVVYVPYSYQIGGYTLIVRREQVEVLDMRLEDAMRFMVTAGVNIGTPGV